MADTRLSDLSAAGALSASDLFYVVQTPGSGGEKATGAQFLTLVGTTYVPLAGGTMTGALTIASGTLTASAPALNITQTWTTGAAFTGALMNITDTSSTSTSKFLDFQVAGSSKFSVSKNGVVTAGSSVLAYDIGVNVSGLIGFGTDVYIYRDTAATLALRNSTAAQTLRVYGTADGAPGSNYQYLQLSANGTTGVTISAVGLGTPGANQDITLTPGGAGSVYVPIGASAAPGIRFIGTDAGFWYEGGLLYCRGQNAQAVNWAMSAAGTRYTSDNFVGWASGNAYGTNADTALARNAAGIVEVNNGTAATYRDLKLRNLLAAGGNGSYVQTPSMTVANLAAAATAGAGARAFVTDANATTFLSTVAAGGANKVPVVSDGTNWLIG